MKISSFSGFLEFAVKQEQQGVKFFVTVPQIMAGHHDDLFLRLKTEAEKNIRSLQMILRENVTELVMEPCDALSERKYHLKDDDELSPLKHAEKILEMQVEFLRDAAGVINLKEVKRAFEKMAGKKELLISEIKNA